MYVRIASLLAFLQALGHTAAVVRWSPSRGGDEELVIEAMKSHDFFFQGLSRSYWDFFFGYGLLTAFNCAVESAVLWQVARLAVSANPATAVEPVGRTLIAILLAANLIHGFLSWRYFFLTPVIFDGAIAVCLAVALVTSRVARR